jgi:hypothetical protein
MNADQLHRAKTRFRCAWRYFENKHLLDARGGAQWRRLWREYKAEGCPTGIYGWLAACVMAASRSPDIVEFHDET